MRKGRTNLGITVATGDSVLLSRSILERKAREVLDRVGPATLVRIHR